MSFVRAPHESRQVDATSVLAATDTDMVRDRAGLHAALT